MSDIDHEQSLAADETVARFILFGKWIREDKTIRQDAFIPHPYPDLSVTRHKGLSIAAIWDIGRRIATVRPATLYGRADITVAEVQSKKLDVVPRPVPENANHATVTGWPIDKPSQKSLAQELASKAVFAAVEP